MRLLRKGERGRRRGGGGCGGCGDSPIASRCKRCSSEMEDTRWWVLDYGSMSITSTQDESTSTEMIDDSIQHMYYEKQMPTQNSTFMFRAWQHNTIHDHSCR